MLIANAPIEIKITEHEVSPESAAYMQFWSVLARVLLEKYFDRLLAVCTESGDGDIRQEAVANVFKFLLEMMQDVRNTTRLYPILL